MSKSKIAEAIIKEKPKPKSGLECMNSSPPFNFGKGMIVKTAINVLIKRKFPLMFNALII